MFEALAMQPTDFIFKEGGFVLQTMMNLPLIYALFEGMLTDYSTATHPQS